MTFDDDERQELRDKFTEYKQTHKQELRDELVAAHLRLAEYLARRFTNRGEPLDDLVQVASLALLKAIERFDPDRGLEFSTFATPTIVGELKRYFRDKGWAVRVPRRIQELHLQLATTVSRLSQELGRSPTIPEIAAHLGASEEEVLESIEAGRAYRFTSIDASAQRGDERSSGAPRVMNRLGDEDPNLTHLGLQLELAPLLNTLPDRERRILHLRFFDGMTQSEIAAHLGISQVHVSRLLARSLQQLREESERAQDRTEVAQSTGHHNNDAGAEH